ncbi:hypothetical protein LQE93_09060 [Clostridium sp. NSJ-145]|uniref:hypothetical protein n=1 Tax=Clostridium sp. NSJ-145 TaxID=2897777 RepID=UPI001E2A569A|nr:hypothetical protein [Clostridium sp. NSJ-145]MCD2501926.1 hypothetical protein [Clostridium sp. NSJ-145]
MKISKKEKMLLGVLGTVLVSVIYYQFVYVNQVEKLEIKRAELSEVENRYTTTMQTIANLENKKSEIKVINSNIEEKSGIFYPTILQEKIILEIDTLITASGLKANISFNPIEVAAVETFTVTEVIKTESTLQFIADSYTGSRDTTLADNNGEQKVENNVVLSNGETSNEGNSQAIATDNSATAEQLKIGISFNGSYDALKRFIGLLEGYSRKINITNLAITPTSTTDVTGSMNLELYGIPKLNDKDIEYLKWELENTYGKDTPFTVGAANGAYSSTIEQLGTEADINDFVMLLRAPASELPTLTLGRANDSDRTTYLYSDNVKTEEAEIEFNELDGKLYYKYKTTSGYYPKDNTSTGAEFTTKSDNIVINITSEARVGTDDNSQVKLKVINNTERKVEVFVEKDDTSNPRIEIQSSGNSVNVKNK